MFDKIITVFNYRADTETWYVSVIEGADIIAARSENASLHGEQNADGVEILIQTDAKGNVSTTDGAKKYTTPKAFSQADTPESLIAFQPLTDFVYAGEYSKTGAISEADSGDMGLYHQLNNTLDGIYLIVSCTRYTLIPHLEVSCK